MTSEERDILGYLKSSPRAYFSALEIARRASGKKVYLANPNWSTPFLSRLVEKGFIEMDGAGHYRLKSQVDTIEANGRKWVSPQIARLLAESKRNFKEVATVEIGEADMELAYA